MVIRRPNTNSKNSPAPPSEPPVDFQALGFSSSTDDDLSDLGDLQYLFVSKPKFTVGTTVPEPVYLKLLKYPGGISKFYEDAITEFDGNLESLLRAASVFAAERRQSRQDTPVRAVNGRISETSYRRVQEMERGLASIRGMSRAKVLAGLMHLKLTSSS